MIGRRAHLKCQSSVLWLYPEDVQPVGLKLSMPPYTEIEYLFDSLARVFEATAATHAIIGRWWALRSVGIAQPACD